MNRQSFELRAAARVLIGAPLPLGVACTTTLAAQPSSTMAPAPTLTSPSTAASTTAPADCHLSSSRSRTGHCRR
jgi:hypothetical protein